MMQFIAGIIVGAPGMLLCWVLCAAAGEGSRLEEQSHWSPKERQDREER